MRNSKEELLFLAATILTILVLYLTQNVNAADILILNLSIYLAIDSILRLRNERDYYTLFMLIISVFYIFTYFS